MSCGICGVYCDFLNSTGMKMIYFLFHYRQYYNTNGVIGNHFVDWKSVVKFIINL